MHKNVSTIYRRSFLLGTVFLAGSTLIGCANWKKNSTHNDGSTKAGFTKHRLPLDAVILEMHVMQFEDSDATLLEETWTQVDESRVDRGIRKHLLNNGFRAGVVSTQVPRELQELIDKHQLRSNHVTEQEKDTTTKMRTPVRVGHPARLVTSPTNEKLSWIANEDGYLHGREMMDARCEFVVSVFPQRDGIVSLKLYPELHYGVPRQRIGVGNSSLKYEMSQDKYALNFLTVDVDLGLGESLVLAPTMPLTGLADSFLKSSNQMGQRPKFILIRLAQTQADNLFERGMESSSIATPID